MYRNINIAPPTNPEPDSPAEDKCRFEETGEERQHSGSACYECKHGALNSLEWPCAACWHLHSVGRKRACKPECTAELY